MKRLYQFIAALAFAAALLLASKPVQAYYCIVWNPITNSCSQYSVDLLPNATWCGANPSPAANEVLLYMGTNYYAPYASSATAAYCQRVVVNSSFQVGNTQLYDLNGPSNWIQSVWLGTSVGVGFWSGSFSGTYKGLCGHVSGSCTATPYYENDMHAHWGFYPGSLAFVPNP